MSFPRKVFSQSEKVLLIKLVDDWKHILEGKITAGLASTKDEKEKAWVNICQLFNEQSESKEHRCAPSLRNLYKNLKRRTRQSVAEGNNELVNTGGDTFSPQLDEVGARVLSIIAPQIKPLPNRFGDGVTYHDKTNRSATYDEEVMNVDLESELDSHSDLTPSRSIPPMPRTAHQIPRSASPTIAVPTPAPGGKEDYYRINVVGVRVEERHKSRLREEEILKATLENQLLREQIHFQKEAHEQNLRHEAQAHAQKLRLAEEAHAREAELHSLQIQLLKKKLEGAPHHQT